MKWIEILPCTVCSKFAVDKKFDDTCSTDCFIKKLTVIKETQLELYKIIEASRG